MFVFNRTERRAALAAVLQHTAILGLKPWARVATVTTLDPVHMSARLAESLDVGPRWGAVMGFVRHE